MTQHDRRTAPRRESPVRDDRVLSTTRWVARLVVPFLLAAALVLYGAPDRTTEFFAWTIRPEMTPVVMGAGYGAGVYFFYRVSTAEEWHRVAPVFLGIAAFTWFMAVATALHWENFNHGHPAFFLWVALYAITPVLIPAVWVFNRRTSPTEPTGEAVLLPRSIRLFGGGLGILATVGALILFVAPGVGAWPWAVSPFTARILAGWLALFGIVNVVVASDPRWSASRILIQSQLFGFALVLVGVVRFWDNFHASNSLTWVFLGGMALYLCGVLALYVRMETRRDDD